MENDNRALNICTKNGWFELEKEDGKSAISIDTVKKIPQTAAINSDQVRHFCPWCRFAGIKYFIKYWSFYPPINYDALIFAFKQVMAPFNLMRMIEFLIQFDSITVLCKYYDRNKMWYNFVSVNTTPCW